MRRAGALVGLAVLAFGGSTSAAAQVSPPPDICLAVELDRLDEATTSAVVDSVQAALATRPVLIPALSIVGPDPTTAESPGATIRLAMWTNGAAEPMAAADVPGAGCGTDVMGEGTWSASITGEFLRAGTKRELAAAGTTPGFTSDIDVEWSEADDLVRTVLTFSGPLGIPNGTCWMDDAVSADGQGGTHAETTTDSVTSPFGDGVCGRFEEYLANGGAGAQALVLLPREIALADGAVLRLRVDGVDVRADGVHLSGGVEEESS
jgi:hypothetical protein